MYFHVVLLLVTVASTQCYKTYEGFKILKVNVSDQSSWRYVRDLEKHLGFQPDFLGEDHSQKQAHFFVDGKKIDGIRKNFDDHNINFSVKEIDQQLFKVRRRRDLSSGTPSFYDINNRYISYEEQMQFISSLAQQHPNLMKIQDLGNSYEGRSLKSVRIADDGTQKPIVWIDAGIHAREWISYNVALYLIHVLVTDPNYSNLLKKVQIVVVPNANPDGYEFSRNYDRMWRKTRSRIAHARCAGADANRNYPFYWGTEGVSHATCSEIFCGTRPQSEQEVLALTNAITREEKRIRAYLALHSYGQEILYPWGHTQHTYPSDVNDLIRVGNQMAKAIRAISNTSYSVINSGDGLYAAAGASDDWAKSREIKYSYTMELSPTDDETGFALPENRIAHVNREAFYGILALIQEVERDPGVSNSPIKLTQTSTPTRGFSRSRGFVRG